VGIQVNDTGLNMQTRRQFLNLTAMAPLVPSVLKNRKDRGKTSAVARYYRKLEGNRVQCDLCPWHCVVSPGERGHCQVRENRHGTYYSLVYGRISAYHNDPVEKKPFFHFMPGTSAFSIASVGCNVDCKFCQNWEIARRSLDEVPFAAFTPDYVVRYAVSAGSKSIAFTYNEPTVSTEFMYDVADIAHDKGIGNLVVSNGFINEKPLKDLCRKVDAYKIDLKSFDESYYRDVVHGRLNPVLDTIVRLRSYGIWTEIVYLVVPTLNDDPERIKAMAQWLYKEAGPDVPVHFSRFYPRYRLRNLPPTPVSTIETCQKIALDAGMHYVYVGNIPGNRGEHTYCPQCGNRVIERIGYTVTSMNLKNGRCGTCGHEIPGRWEDYNES